MQYNVNFIRYEKKREYKQKNILLYYCVKPLMLLQVNEIRVFKNVSKRVDGK